MGRYVSRSTWIRGFRGFTSRWISHSIWKRGNGKYHQEEPSPWNRKLKPEDIWDPAYQLESDEQVYSKVDRELEERGVKPAPAVASNSKTGASFDCVRICGKTIRANYCPYCYVEAARERRIRQFATCGHTEYSRDQLERQLKRLGDGVLEKGIEALNKLNGLRLFAVADFVDTPRCRQMLDRLIDDACDLGLKLKAVTKREDFVEEYADRRCPDGSRVFTTINVSVDRIGSGMRWSKAKELKRRFPELVKIRAVALNEDDLKFWEDQLSWVDVVTPYHGPRVDYSLEEYLAPMPPEVRSMIREEIEQRRAEGEEVVEEMRFEDIRRRIRDLRREHPEKYTFCCGVGSAGYGCGSCAVKCGAELASSHSQPPWVCKTSILEDDTDELTSSDYEEWTGYGWE